MEELKITYFSSSTIYNSWIWKYSCSSYLERGRYYNRYISNIYRREFAILLWSFFDFQWNWTKQCDTLIFYQWIDDPNFEFLNFSLFHPIDIKCVFIASCKIKVDIVDISNPIRLKFWLSLKEILLNSRK